MRLNDLTVGQRVMITVEGVICVASEHKPFIALKGPWGRMTITDVVSDLGISVEKLSPERPTWWDKVRPGAMVQTSNSVSRRAIKRSFDGMWPPADAKTHPWMWDNGKPATEDEILEWGPVVLLIQGRN